MAIIQETNLILNPDGSVYHLGLRPEHVAEIIIGVGDPGRVERVTRHFDAIDFRISRREFTTHTGRIGNKRITVISTGIGTDNVEIVLTELDALFNIDLSTREEKKRKTSLSMVRIGTSGSLRKEVPVDSHLVSDYAIGLDNLMQFYDFQMSLEEEQLSSEVRRSANLPFAPVVARGDVVLRDRIGDGMLKGNTATCPGFYAPQGRTMRLPIRFPQLLDALGGLEGKVSNFEMETAGYFSLARLLGHRVASVSAILANRVTNVFSTNPEKVVDALIAKVLERI